MANQYTLGKKQIFKMLLWPVTLILIVAIVCGAWVDIQQAKSEERIRAAEIQANR